MNETKERKKRKISTGNYVLRLHIDFPIKADFALSDHKARDAACYNASAIITD